MKHPFTGQSIVYYLLAWATIIVAHSLVLFYNYDLSLRIALTDALTFNIALGIFGFSLWWAVQYLTPTKQGTISMIITFALIVVIGALAVSMLGDTMMNQFFREAPEYLAFTDYARPWKVVTGSLYLSMIVLTYYLLKHAKNLKEKIEEEHKLQDMLKHSELEMLKFQINPHFIFNSLNSVSALTLSAPDQAREMVIKLSDFLRGSLGQSQEEMHALKDELAQMNLYLDIEKVRFGERLTVNLEIDEALLNMQVPNMILQPLYENAIKYGVYEQLEAVEITTSAKINNSILEIRVTNNFDSQAAVQKGKGIGLNNTRSRLELIYGIPDLVTIERGKDTFSVKLEIPQTQAYL